MFSPNSYDDKILFEHCTISCTEANMRITLPNRKISRQIYSNECNMEEIDNFQFRAIPTDTLKIFDYSPKICNVQTGISMYLLLVKFNSSNSSKHVTVKITSRDLYLKDICILADSRWHLLTDNYVTKTDFDLSLKIDSVKENDISRLKLLCDDDNLADFELRGDDGSVKVHKAILATSSPVFKTMLQGEWKESVNGFVHLEGISKVTLQEFKEYIYLNSLSSTMSPQLLIIAMRYMMPDMEAMCVQTLVNKIKSENAYDLLEFAITQKSTKLTLEILKCIEKGLIQVNLIEQHIFDKKDETPRE